MRTFRLLLLPLVSLTLGACSMQWPSYSDNAPTGSTASTPVRTTGHLLRPSTPSAPRVATLQSSGPYRLDSGDRVRVVVAGDDTLSNSYDVDTTGSIDIPSVGAVSARGLNTVQLSSAIARKLKTAKLREPHVAVQVETYRPFSIQGDVNNPGQYPYVNNMTTETAIAIAGGLKSRTAKKSVTISPEPDNAPPAPTQAESPVRPGDSVIVTEER